MAEAVICQPFRSSSVKLAARTNNRLFMENSSLTAFYAAALVGLGALCNWLAWRINLPAILFLLFAGLLLGPAFGVLDPDAAMGDLLFPFVSLGVAIILFEGALTLRFSDIRNVTGIIRNLTTVGVLVTWAVMGCAAHYIAGLSWPIALLFGALVTVTGPTVIAPMLRSIRPNERVSNVLHWEGILIDPIGAALAVLVFEFIHSGGGEAASLLVFSKVVVIGTGIGFASGLALAFLLKRHLLPDFLKNFFVLASVLVVFTIANLLGSESGLIAVTVLGIVLANTRDLDVRELIAFKEDLTLLMLSLLFILLAARLQVDELKGILVASLLLLLTALFVARPLSVWISSFGTSVSGKEKLLLSWVAPRGIVAAAVSSLFALKLSSQGVEEANLLVPLTFVIIIGTVVIQSLTAGTLAQALGLSSRDKDGVLITAANRVTLELGDALHSAGVKVMIVDTDHGQLRKARMRGLDVFFGNPLSEYTERYLDMTGYNFLLAGSRRHAVNTMICNQFRHQFDSQQLFMVRTGPVDANTEEEDLVPELRFNVLFGKSLSWKKFSSLLSQGAEIRATPLTDQYGLDEYRERMGVETLALFGLDPDGKLHFNSNGKVPEPGPGWTLASLVPAPVVETLQRDRQTESRKKAMDAEGAAGKGPGPANAPA